MRINVRRARTVLRSDLLRAVVRQGKVVAAERCAETMAEDQPCTAERWRQACGELASVRAEFKRARRSERAAEAKRARQWVLSEQMKDIVLTVYALADCATEPAAAYLRTCALQRHWPTKTTEELEILVETCS